VAPAVGTSNCLGRGRSGQRQSVTRHSARAVSAVSSASWSRAGFCAPYAATRRKPIPPPAILADVDDCFAAASLRPIAGEKAPTSRNGARGHLLANWSRSRKHSSPRSVPRRKSGVVHQDINVADCSQGSTAAGCSGPRDKSRIHRRPLDCSNTAAPLRHVRRRRTTVMPYGQADGDFLQRPDVAPVTSAVGGWWLCVDSDFSLRTEAETERSCLIGK